jgi:hypothetical protein
MHRLAEVWRRGGDGRSGSKTINESGHKTGGEAGIRTLDTAFGPYNGLANRRLQPLGHLTAARNLSIRQASSYGNTGRPIVPEIVPASSQNPRLNGGARAIQAADPHAAVRFDDNYSATDWPASISSHEAASTFLIGRGARTETCAALPHRHVGDRRRSSEPPLY